jgi:lipid-A-disaccharide synthase
MIISDKDVDRMRIFISAGEPSGDLHGANLIKALKKANPTIECIGFGGERMEAAGCRLLFPLTSLAVMWFLAVLVNIFKFLRLLKQAKRYFHEERPDAVVLIDFPGFHWALAKRAHAAGIPVYYFVPPQLWAWAPWRVKKMKKWVTHVLSALPFENRWYRERGVKSNYIGHPYFDELAVKQLDGEFLARQRAGAGRVIALLPGSRMQEVLRNLPDILAAAAIIHERSQKTRFLIASFNEAQAAVARERIAGLGLPIDICVGHTPEVIELAEACIAVSGSVSLEIMYKLKPAAIIYRLKWISLRLGRLFKLCKYITLVNLLADREIYPEFLTDRSPAAEIAERVLEWLNDPAKAAAVREALQQVKDAVAEPGACDRAAGFLLLQLGERKRRQAA